MVNRFSISLALVSLLVSSGLWAQTTKTARVTVSAQLAPACNAGASNGSGGIAFGTLNFGSVTTLLTPVSVTGQQNTGGIRVQCVSGVSYKITMDNGVNALLSQRRMKNTSNTSAYVNYGLYTDAARSNNWNNTTGISVVGNGNDQWTPVYGYVPTQAAPIAGTYQDTITVTITW